MWKKKLHEEQWQKSHFQIRFWRGETPVGSLASLSGLAPPWHHALVSGSHLDPKIQAPELSELESVEVELGSCCSNLDKQVSDEICRTRKRQFEIPFRLKAAACPEWLRARFLLVVFFENEEELTRKTFTTSLNTPNPNTYVKFIFLRTSPLRQDPPWGYFCHLWS